MSIEQRFVRTCVDATPFDLAPAHALNVPRRSGLTFKRALDIALAAPLLFVLGPLLVVIAALIRRDSAGPALFRQTRRGLGGKPFDILKFRTMWVMENGDHIVQATRGDCRITRVGRFLRRTSLDELPQLINVLRGEMSLIGPRPHARAHDDYYSALIPDYSRRQTVRPGITGWAQVNGLRGETRTVDCMRKRVQCDLWYIDNFNTALDCKILLLTVFEVLRRRNAR